MLQRARDAVLGNCGFKGPPTADGVVEIAYGIAPYYQGKGYATEAARALSPTLSATARFARSGYTRARNRTRVLTKCGFRRVGEVMDPDDGLVWRSEKDDESA